MKTKHRTRLQSLGAELRISFSTSRPRIKKLCAEHQAQISHSPGRPLRLMMIINKKQIFIKLKYKFLAEILYILFYIYIYVYTHTYTGVFL
jgi:hypothetical protein